MENIKIYFECICDVSGGVSLSYEGEHPVRCKFAKGECIMLKKIISLFKGKIQETPVFPPVPERCYQPELPFE